MSNKLLTAVWDRAPYYGGALLVYLALADQASDEGMCWPAVPTIAAKARMNVRNCQKHLQRLEVDGAVTRHSRRGRSTIYEVHEPAWLESPPPQDTAAPPAPPTPVTEDTPVARDTPQHKTPVVRDTTPLSPETPPPVVRDTTPLSPETPRTPMEPLMNPQMIRGPFPVRKMERAEPEPERLTWGELEAWCNRNHVPKHAPDRVRAWNAAHPNRVWGVPNERIVEGSIADSVRPGAG